MSKTLFEELLRLYLLDSDIFKTNIVKSWDLFTPFLPSQDTREQTVILDTWVIQVGSCFARSLGDKKPCYIRRLSLRWTRTAIGWFLVTCPWLKSNVSRSWYIKQCTPLTARDQSMVQKWCDRRREKHCQFSFSWMKATTWTQTRSL